MTRNDRCSFGPCAASATASRETTVIDRHSSVFAKLVAVMVTMAASLLLLVGGFFWFIVSPAVSTSIDRVLEEHARTIAATGPPADAAKSLAAPLDLQVRYEGPAGPVASANHLPSIGDAKRAGRRIWAPLLHGRHYYIVPGPDGGSYLFAWSVPTRMQSAHVTLLILLLLLMTAVVLVAHTILNRLLRPLRRLSEG